MAEVAPGVIAEAAQDPRPGDGRYENCQIRALAAPDAKAPADAETDHATASTVPLLVADQPLAPGSRRQAPRTIEPSVEDDATRAHLERAA